MSYPQIIDNDGTWEIRENFRVLIDPSEAHNTALAASATFIPPEEYNNARKLAREKADREAAIILYMRGEISITVLNALLGTPYDTSTSISASS